MTGPQMLGAAMILVPSAVFFVFILRAMAEDLGWRATILTWVCILVVLALLLTGSALLAGAIR